MTLEPGQRVRVATFRSGSREGIVVEDSGARVLVKFSDGFFTYDRKRVMPIPSHTTQPATQVPDTTPPALVPQPRQNAVRSPKHLAWLRTQPCAFCGAPAPSEASHHGKHGVGTKPSDLDALPACRTCHQRWHDRGRPAPWCDSLSRETMRELFRVLAEDCRGRREG